MEYRGMPADEPGRGSREAAPARIYLQPIASPWTLGLMSLGAAAFILGARWAGWYGRPGTTILLFPFLLTVGGLLQLLAGMWSFRARDAIGAVALTTWGAFFLGYGMLNWSVAAGTLPLISFRELGIVLFALAMITASAAWAAASENRALMFTLAGFAVAAALVGIGLQSERFGVSIVGGFVLVLSALAAYYTATAMLLEASFGEAVLPMGKPLGVAKEQAVDTGLGEPGVIRHTHPGLRRVEAEPGEPGGQAAAQG